MKYFETTIRYIKISFFVFLPFLHAEVLVFRAPAKKAYAEKACFVVKNKSLYPYTSPHDPFNQLHAKQNALLKGYKELILFCQKNLLEGDFFKYEEGYTYMPGVYVSQVYYYEKYVEIILVTFITKDIFLKNREFFRKKERATQKKWKILKRKLKNIDMDYIKYLYKKQKVFYF